MTATGEPSSARSAKSPAAFRTIGEVAEDLDLPTHVLRFWETKFPQLKPLKRGGGRRYYRPEDILLLRRIRQCLYQDGYTIRGVQKLLGGSADENSAKHTPAAPTLFPLEAASAPIAASDPESSPDPDPPLPPPKPARPARRRQRPDSRAALEDIRRELLEIRALVGQLIRKPAGS